MTFSPKVWGDALRRLQNDTPDFAFDAWIAPLQAKRARDQTTGRDRIVLGCPNSFHRDRIRLHHLDAIERAIGEALRADAETRPRATPLSHPPAHPSSEAPDPEAGHPPPIDLLAAAEFKAIEGHCIEARVGMRRVGHARTAEAVNAPTTSGASSTVGHTETTLRTRPSTPPAERPTLRALPSPSADAPAQGKRVEPARNDAVAAPDAPSPPEGPRFDLDGQPAPRSRGAASEPVFSFESFIVGPCNALAREAALALARQRQQSLNLLYLAGLSGMGKTHLAKAAAEAARLDLASRAARRVAEPDARPTAQRARVLYTTAEQFTTDFVSAMRNGRNEAWAARYRGPIALLVVEDVQSLEGRTKTQQELYHTIAHVLESGGRALLTGDRSPRNLTGLDDALRAQVGRGFVAELDRPDPIVRRHILRAKAAAGGVHLPSDCLERLVDATECSATGKGLGSSVTEIESLLIQVVTTASLLSRPIDAALVQEAIEVKSGGAAALAPRQVAVPEIVKAVAAFFGTRPELLASRSRRRDVLLPRQLAMYLADRYTNASYTEIGRALDRDHPSVANAIKKIERQILENAPVRYQVEALSEKIDSFLADA